MLKKGRNIEHFLSEGLLSSGRKTTPIYKTKIKKCQRKNA